MQRTTAGLYMAIWLAVPWMAQAGSPAVVTTVVGDVKLVTDGTAGELPPPPVVLTEGQALQLVEGAMAVVLCGGSATKLTGPDTVGLDRLVASAPVESADVGALNDLLSRKTSTARPAASRGVGDASLLRPVPRTAIIAPTAIAWACDNCGTQQVQVYDFRADEVVWTGEGDGQVDYSGPELRPGAYYVVIGSRDYPFTVAPAEERARVEGALRALDGAAATLAEQGLDDPASRVALDVAVLLQAEMPTEALYRIDAALAAHPDDAALKAQRATIEARAGLAP